MPTDLLRTMITGFNPAAPNESICRNQDWRGAIMVLAFWFGYASIGLMQPGDNLVQTESEHDDD